MLTRKSFAYYSFCRRVTYNLQFRSSSGCNGGSLNESSTTIVKLRFPLTIKNLPKSVALDDMNELMGKIGHVSDLCLQHNDNDKINCALFYDNLECSLKAVKMFENVSIGGGKISIELGSTEKMLTNTINDNETRSSSTLLVGNIHYKISWQDLSDYLSSTGMEVQSVYFIPQSSEKVTNINNLTTRQVVSAAVTFKNRTDATTAMYDFNNRMFHGHALSIKYQLLEDLPRDTINPKPVSPTAESNASTLLFVSNLVQGVTWMELKDHFRLAGQVVNARITSGNSQATAFGYVHFATLEEANLALVQMHNTLLRGQPVYVCEPPESCDESVSPVESEVSRRRDENVSRNNDNGQKVKEEENKQYDDDKLLYVGNIPLDVYWSDFKERVKTTLGYEVGDVFLRLSLDGSQQEALVEFETVEDARYACRKLQTLVVGRSSLVVRPYEKDDSSKSSVEEEGNDEQKSLAMDV